MPKLKTPGKLKINLDTDQTLSNILGNQNNPMKIQGGPDDVKKIGEMLRQNLQANQTPAPKKKARKTRQTTAIPASLKAQAQNNNDDGKLKENLISRVLKYQASKRFAKTLKQDMKINYSREQLSRMTVEKIELILHRIRNHLNSRNLDAVFEHMATTCAIGYEKTITPFYNINGFSKILLSNPDFWDCLERWKIEKELPNIPPHIQMLYIVASTTITAHEFNKFDLRQPQSQQINNEDLVIVDEDDNKKKSKEDKEDNKQKRTNFQIGKQL